MQEKEKMKRLSMFVPDELHTQLKIASISKGITMTEYVVELITDALAQEVIYDQINQLTKKREDIK